MPHLIELSETALLIFLTPKNVYEYSATKTKNAPLCTNFEEDFFSKTRYFLLGLTGAHAFIRCAGSQDQST